MMDYLDGRWRCQSLVYFDKPNHPRMSRAVPSGRREGMFPGRYSEIFGLGERRMILNLGHSLTLSTNLLVCRYTLAPVWLCIPGDHSHLGTAISARTPNTPSTRKEPDA